MPDISFDGSGKVRFPTRHHGEVTLSKGKWNKICSEPERYYYRFNGEKVATTLVNPDSVRHSTHYPNQFHYYKGFASIRIAASVDACMAKPPCFCVVIDESTKRVCTVYPVREPKPGKEFKGREKVQEDEKGN